MIDLPVNEKAMPLDESNSEGCGWGGGGISLSLSLCASVPLRSSLCFALQSGALSGVWSWEPRSESKGRGYNFVEVRCAAMCEDVLESK